MRVIFLSSYVYVDVADMDIGTYVKEAKSLINKNVGLATGVALVWSGQFKNMARAWGRLKLIIPITLFIVCLLLYANTKSWFKTGIILLAVPFSAVGAIWLLYLLGYNMSIAVWIDLFLLFCLH